MMTSRVTRGINGYAGIGEAPYVAPGQTFVLSSSPIPRLRLRPLWLFITLAKVPERRALIFGDTRIAF